MTLPPGPDTPSLLQTLQVIAKPTVFLDHCAQTYGDTFTLRVLGTHSPPVVFLSHPDSIQAIFTTLSGMFELGKVTDVFRPLVGNKSLIMQDGVHHQRQRHLLMPAMHRESLVAQGELIRQLASARILTWQSGQQLSIHSEMAEISLQVILRVVFGLTPGDRYRQLQQLLTKLLVAITHPIYSIQFFLPPLQVNLGPWSPWGKFRKQMQAIDHLIYAEIAERRNQDLSDRTDILSMLMCAQDDLEQALSNQELRDQLITLLLLGHETTASALAWAFYWLHRHPTDLEHLRQELAPLSPETDAKTLSEQPFLTAVCKEALRVYPIALIAQPRRVQKAITLESYHFEPGTVLVPCIYNAHRRTATYGDPDVFRPDRFIARKFSNAEFFPFGGGSRGCIGMALSMLEMKLVLATVLPRIQLRLVHNDKPRPTRRGITFVPSATLFQVAN
jgi:cytochrome P450 family 110